MLSLVLLLTLVGRNYYVVSSSICYKYRSPNTAYPDLYCDNKEYNFDVEELIKYEVGDRAKGACGVRILNEKSTFAKENAMWSVEIYDIVERVWNTFRLTGDCEILQRLYKPQEMAKVKVEPTDCLQRVGSLKKSGEGRDD